MFFHTFLPSNSQPEAGKGWVVGGYRVLYSAANDPQPQLIPRPQMIPKVDRK